MRTTTEDLHDAPWQRVLVESEVLCNVASLLVWDADCVNKRMPKRAFAERLRVLSLTQNTKTCDEPKASSSHAFDTHDVLDALTCCFKRPRLCKVTLPVRRCHVLDVDMPGHVAEVLRPNFHVGVALVAEGNCLAARDLGCGPRYRSKPQAAFQANALVARKIVGTFGCTSRGC